MAVYRQVAAETQIEPADAPHRNELEPSAKMPRVGQQIVEDSAEYVLIGTLASLFLALGIGTVRLVMNWGA